MLASFLALLAVALQAADTPQRLVNLSTRAQVGIGNAAPVVGFVVGDGPRKRVLVRAVGPGLNQFGLTGTLANPRLVLQRVVNNAGVDVTGGVNDDWATPAANAPALTTAFGQTGAFQSINTRDAAVVVDLEPGAYTAQVTGVGTPNTGLVLLEVYDVTGAARLMNLSTRAMVGTGAGVLISGLSVPPGAGTRKILVRASGPSLGAVAPAFATTNLADPALAITDLSNNTQIASNDNWSSANAAAITAGASQTGAFAFLADSKDAALIADLVPGRNYSIQVSGVNNTTGIALIEVYDLTPENLANVSIVATNASTDTKGAAPAVFSVNRTGSTASALTVFYTTAGTAVAGVDYANVSGSVTIPAGASTASVSIAATSGSTGPAINKDVTLALTPGPGYAMETDRSASVSIFYNPGSLYITSLRATPGAASTAYGTATIQVAADNTFAIVNLSFSNLSSPETVAYLRVGNPGEVGVDVFRLPNGQVNGQVWQFQASGALSVADIVRAIKDGRVFVSIESANYPTGELRGAFLQSTGSLTFTAPSPPPVLAAVPLTAVDASRFLAQATFGPTKTEIDALTGKSLADLNQWITSQMALAPSAHLDATRADYFAFDAGRDGTTIAQSNRQAAWWMLSLKAPDQLRQRVAFALSEILVVSDANPTLFNNARGEGMSNYYDILVRGAFGNFRQLLENVTLSPIMGFYLSALRNGKGTLSANGQVLTSADENYAREVMQLFSIGLNQLQPDGTLKLDALGVPIPTYDQKTITEMAKVFTGWGYYQAGTNPSFRGAPAEWIRPMMLYPAFHDDTEKAIVGDVVIPPNQGGARDLQLALDALANHPNTGPFISRQLIQRLVTSNPSPGYVYRVAQAFANNGSGVRGDLGAVVRTILTDYEARSMTMAGTASFGKLREPLLRATALLRAFNGGANTGRFAIFNPEGGTTASLTQAALRAPTVFNFFEPNYVQPGPLANAGLYAPEYQILTDTTAINLPNQLWNYIYANRSSGATINVGETTVGFVFDSDIMAMARTPQPLVNYANLVLAGGGLPKATTDRIVTLLNALPTNTSDLERVRSAFYLTVSVPQGAIQK